MTHATGGRTGGGPTRRVLSSTVAQHLALSDATLDTYPKIVDAVRSFVKVQRLGRES